MGVFDQQDRPPAGSRFPRGIIIAVIIAIMGLFMYWQQVEVNPVTGARQHVSISPEQEIRLGLESAPEMSREMGGVLSSSDPRTQEVKKIGQLLVDNSIASRSPWKFQFHLLADPETVNAFALPGGQIFITLGLLTKLQTEAQLAGVLSHEMGHVIERHSSQQMAKSQLGQLLVMAVGVGASNDQYPSGANSPAMIAQFVNQMFQLRYSRKDESEADTWGLKLMEAVGYDPRSMIQLMEILKLAGGNQETLDFFNTHPNPDLRIQQIKEYLAKNPLEKTLKQGRSLRNGVPIGAN